MASYKLTLKATKDLRNIWNYTVDTWSENQADQCYHMLLNSCQEKADGKGKGKKYVGIYSGLLGIKAGEHIIFYRQMTKDRVEIARILHERMDLRSRMELL
jgi:toxin ParE1/3/4